ncbi:MAG: 30S ribosomal protein S2 [Candidatus Krumholzibacteria bacterium]|nr:30S ribosomal protein S2 [Candidatus Krumholzibacteria bacterium]
MGEITLKDLLEAGVHFGHQTKRWNPKMKPYIFMEKNGIHVIDLQKTLENAQKAKDAIRKEVEKGKDVLFLGTKPQAKNAVREEASRCGMPYVTERWLGGTLTNFDTIRKSLDKLEYFEKIEADGRIDQFSKKEALRMSKAKDKLLRSLGGIRTMSSIPAFLFVIDTKKEINAVREAKKLKIPIVGLIDTNADPGEVDYPIPANDDAMRAINLFCKLVADACLEGKAKFLEGQEVVPPKEEGEPTKTSEAESKENTA